LIINLYFQKQTMISTLTYIVQVMTLNNFQNILAIARYSLKKIINKKEFKKFLKYIMWNSTIIDLTSHSHVWWLNIDNEIENLEQIIKNCAECNINKNKSLKINYLGISYLSIQTCTYRFCWIIFKDHNFLILDTYTKWIEVHIVHNNCRNNNKKISRDFLKVWISDTNNIR